MKTAFLDISGSIEDSAVAARGRILELASHCGGPAWVLLQAFTGISCSRWDPDNPAFSYSFDSVFNGRIFGPHTEVRWVREGSLWQIWRTAESDVNLSRQCTYRDRRYYLWGIYRSDYGRFMEDRIPGVPDDYFPVTVPRDDDRAFMDVREYESLIDATGIGEIEDQLNQPYISAHRFLRINSGRDVPAKPDRTNPIQEEDE